MTLLFVGCENSSEEATLWEGASPGECNDGADNDGDGTYDCADPDCFGAPECTTSTTNTDESSVEAWEALLRAIDDELSFEEVPGVVVSIVLDGQLAFATGRGSNQYGGGIPASQNMVFRWNSISKMHTAAALLLLAEEGSYDLDAPVTDYVPDVELSGEFDDPSLVTGRHLMTHSAALPDMYTYNCTDDLTEHWSTQSPQPWAPSGTFYNYSNEGWSLAGRVAEAITGLGFDDLIQELVLEPSQMETATFDPSEAMDNSPYAIGYSSGTFYTPENNDCAYTDPAGGLHATVLDLAKTMEIHIADGGDLLSKGSVHEMRSQMESGYPWMSEVGLGQFKYEHKGVEYLSHGGAGVGFVSSFKIVPDHGFGVAIASNASWTNVDGLALKAMDLFLNLPVEFEEERYDTNPSTWTRFEGIYEDSVYYGTIEVYLNSSDQLRVILHDVDEGDFRLYQYGGNAFYFVDSGSYYYIRFMAGDDGSSQWFVNRYWVAERWSGAEAAPAPSASTKEQTEIKARSGEESPRAVGAELSLTSP